MAAIRNNIKMYRAKFHMTQEDLARRVQVTRQTILAIENGKYLPSLELALKLAREFHEPVEHIFTYAEASAS